jgi:hypothetical protein
MNGVANFGPAAAHDGADADAAFLRRSAKPWRRLIRIPPGSARP